ncbi:hypothetical protein [Pseudarthrobacter sp. NamB4]|uniref:hypothetical protein n=1 Tax=Pseudarthrobacter sp. NamB4 TaxID=2576837 RepID=UPI0010FE145F|nr:hypothetical protein [Pseudarthrobacter sp. NamB4]TLM73276.1 hypothetical protein FDW81_09605 [Pseudarthrobacter sp. NamB4]
MHQHPKNIQPGEESVSRAELNQSPEEVLEYWTEQRMAEARPRELRLPEEGPRLKQRGADTGEPGSDPPAHD